MDNNTDTIAIISSHEWPTVRTVTITPGQPVAHDTTQARLLDCRSCFEAGRGMINHLDGSACVERPELDGGF